MKQAKFKPGDIVFIGYKMSVLQTKIVAVDYRRDGILYFIFGLWYEEDEVYANLEKAIEKEGIE